MRVFLCAGVGLLAACSSGPSGPSVRQEAPGTIVAGNASTCLLSTAGRAYCWGADSTGLLGIGSTITAQLSPAAVTSGQTYTAISGAESFRCGLSSGAAWCWGQSLSGSHGAYLYTDTVPTMIAGSGDLATIAVGPSHGCGLTSNGGAYCWGENYYGQLGAGDTVQHPSAVAVVGGMHFVAISVGFWHTCALTTSGAAYCWGENAVGELGVPPAAPVSYVTSPQAVSGGMTFASISAGSLYTCALTSAGAAYCWGLNNFGNLGDGTDTSRTTPTPVSQSGLAFATIVAYAENRVTETTCGITTSGAAYCWGFAGNGQLGDPAVTAESSPTPVPVSGGLTFATVSVGATHACGITKASTTYCWGQNDHGQLGDGTTQASVIPVAVTGTVSAELTRHAWR
jgi:alpha-tubulin suppressor-like RCC1 family protein